MTHEQIVWNILSSVAILLGVLAAYLRGRSERRTNHAETTTKIDAVQTTVNGETRALHERVDDLTAGLTAAGVDVPKDSRRAE